MFGVRNIMAGMSREAFAGGGMQSGEHEDDGCAFAALDSTKCLHDARYRLYLLSVASFTCV